MKTVFVHPERCLGCKQCEVACAVEHSQSKNLFWAVFESPLPVPRIHTEPGVVLNTAFPNKCRHCNPAPCMSACPAAAISRAQDLIEIVVVDDRKCIACGMCAMVCPFDVITYHAIPHSPEKPLVAVKCDQCIERQREGVLPACVEACKVSALEFGELNELVRAARTHYSEMVSAAVGQVPREITALPAEIEGWRGWGVAVSGLNANGKKGA